MGGRSYSRSPPPRGGGGGYGRRRSPSPRGRHGGGGGRDRDLPTSLLVRNLRRDCRPEDLRRPFGQFGPLKDVYLPRDYYSGEPRGFGFVQFVDPADAAEAKYQMDGQIMQGREVTVVFAEENRKKPVDMRARERPSSGRSRGHERRRSPPRYSRSPPRRGRSRSRSPVENYDPAPSRRQHSRSISPHDKRRSSRGRGRAYSGSLPPATAKGSRSPSRSPARSRSRSAGGDYGRQARERSISQCMIPSSMAL